MFLPIMLTCALAAHLLGLAILVYFVRQLHLRVEHLTAPDQQLASSRKGGVREDLLRPKRESDQQRALDRPEEWSAPSAAMPEVRISRQLLHRLAAGIRREHEIHPYLENGFALIGRTEGDGDDRRLVINGMIESGPATDRSAGHVRFDREYQQQELDLMQIIDPRASHVGDAHLHPGTLDCCSSGDLITDVANVRASATQEMIFVIATLRSAYNGSARIHGDNNCIAGIKLDFYYLGHTSGFRYRRIQPEQVDEPILIVPEYLRGRVREDAVAAKLDSLCLRNIPATRVHLRELVSPDGGPALPCLEIVGDDRQERLILLLGESSHDTPQVLVELDGRLEAVDMPSPVEGTDCPWLTHLVLKARKIVSRRTDGAMRLSEVCTPGPL
jgi:hypothetical protein